MSKNNSKPSFQDFVEIVARLRDPENGCPWDLEQTHESLKPFLLEETYETLEAIDEHPEKLCDELGDLLLQIVLHAQIASEEKRFTIEDVIENVHQKMIRRHPHVFGNTEASTTKEVLKNWETIKAEERKKTGTPFDGIPKHLPALARTHQVFEKSGRKAVEQRSTEKILQDIDLALESLKKQPEDKEKHLGNLLFSLCQFAWSSGLQAEDILRQKTKNFIDSLNTGTS